MIAVQAMPIRPLTRAVSLTVAAGLLSLACLTALHHILDWPAVQRFDHGVQQAVHAHASPALTAIMLTLTWIGAIKLFAPTLTLWIGYLAARDRLFEARTLGFAMLGAMILNETLKLHFRRPRPGLPWSIGDEHTFSFPSGHSLFAVVLYGTVAWLAWRTGRRWPLVLAILMPLGIGLSRIYLGMHYPTDVLGGYMVGGIWLGAVVAIASASERQRSSQPSGALP